MSTPPLPTFVGAGGALTQQAALGLATWAGGAWSAVTVTGAFTLTPAQMLGAGDTFLTLNGTPAAFNMTTPSALQLLQQVIAALGFIPEVGFTFQFEASNNTGNTATLVAGAGVTIVGTATVATLVNRTWLGTVTNNSMGQPAISLQNVGSRAN
jgi:hypothetical protein